MSKIQAKPFIESIIGSLTGEQKSDLVGLLNGSDKTAAVRSLINPAAKISEADAGVSFISLETQTTVFTGYLIYNDDYCVLVAFAKDTQALTIVDIDLDNQLCSIVGEPLSILELRTVLGIDLLDVSTRYIETSNIKNLTDDEIQHLRPGDIVVKKTGNQRHAYVVSYKENGQGICLTYVDASTAETVSYDKVGDHWVYNSTDITPLSGFDPSTLIGKFVRIIPAPESTTLTAEQQAIFAEGVFINGTFLEYKNPIILPTPLNSTGALLAVNSWGNTFIQSIYINGSGVVSKGGSIIEMRNQSIVLWTTTLNFYGKNFPTLPTDNTKQYKLVYKTDETLAWEEDA